ncbi:hypothetical protein D3C72_1416760 [compost metagenome]
MLRRLLLLKFFGLLFRFFLALLFSTLRVVTLLLLAVVLLHHCPGIDHHCTDDRTFATAAGTVHVDVFLQRSPNQQGNQYKVQNDRNNNGAVQLIVLLSCLYQNRFPKTGVAYTGFLSQWHRNRVATDLRVRLAGSLAPRKPRPPDGEYSMP